MRDQLWDAFVIYVNAYYAVQEAYDSARRNWERPAQGLDRFCRDANPFLWDSASSAEEALYETFLERFVELHPKGACTAQDGRVFARSWLASLEGDAYGTSLVDSLDSIADEAAWEESCEPVARQLAHRAARLERTPQDVPLPPEYEPVPEPVPESEPAAGASHADSEDSESQALTDDSIEAVIRLLAKGDDDFAASLRARLAADEDD